MNNEQKSCVKIGVNIFLIKENKILLGKRIGKSGYGTWCLPGGHFEYAESLIDAAKRELKEETGIDSENIEFLHLINDPLNDSHYIHINFIAKDWQGKARVTEPDKFLEWKWFNITAIPEKIFIGHQKFLNAYLKKVKFVDKQSYT